MPDSKWKNLFRLSKASQRVGLAYITLSLLTVIVGLLPGIGFLRYYIDGNSISRRAIHSTLRLVLWEKPVQVEGLLSTMKGNYDIFLSADEKVMLLTRDFEAGNADIYITRLIEGDWLKPVPIRELNTKANERTPSLSFDGKILYFSSDRSGGQGGFDIWAAKWTGYEWGKPYALEELNSPADEIDPFQLYHGGKLFFASNREQTENPAAIKAFEEFEIKPPEQDFDIYLTALQAPKEGKTFPPLVEKPSLFHAANTPFNETGPAVNPAEDLVYFASDRPDGLGFEDIWRSRFVDGFYNPPENLGRPVNTAFEDTKPNLTMKGLGLFFSSSRRSLILREYNIYSSRSREVNVRIDVPMLISLLLILLLLGLSAWLLWFLIHLMFTRKNMKLIWRCLLLSLLLHFFLAALSGGWYLSSKISDVLREQPPEMTINMNTLARESIALEIREGVASMPKVQTSASSSRPSEPTPIPEQRPVQTSAEAQPVAEMEQATTDAVSPITVTEPLETYSDSPPEAELTQNVEPFQLTMNEVSMEMPEGVPQKGDGDSKTPTAAKQPVPKKAVRKAEELPEIRKVPVKLTASSLPSPAGETDIKFDNSYAPEDKMRTVLRDPNESEGLRLEDKGTNEKLIAAAGTPSLEQGKASSLGLIRMPTLLKLEVVREKKKPEETPEPELLKHDPFRTAIAFLEVLHGQRIEFVKSFYLNYLLRNNVLDYDSFRIVLQLLKGGKLNRVGDLVASSLPRFEMPADSEMETPEENLY